MADDVAVNYDCLSFCKVAKAVRKSQIWEFIRSYFIMVVDNAGYDDVVGDDDDDDDDDDDADI